MTRAIHVNSTAPFFARNGEKAEYYIEKAELFCTIISALEWRKENGKISLIADSAAYAYYEYLGMLSVWDEALPNLTEENVPDPLTFWAAGKLLALQKTPAPVAIIDTDFIVWKKLLLGERLVAAHREDISSDIYPDPSFFRLNGFSVNPAFSRNVLPLNTAFLYLPDESFKQYYVNQSLAFMRSLEPTHDRLCPMVFAEQRLLAMCADYLKMPVECLLDKDRLFEKQACFTHLWGAKRVMRTDGEQLRIFCERARARIIKDFPEYSALAEKIGKLPR